MNWWVIALILGSVALIVGPIMMMQPNSAQRYQEALRSRAYQAGLRVRVQTLPQQSTDLEAPLPMPVYYLPRGPEWEAGDWLLLRAAYAHEAHFHDDWVWQGTGRPDARELQWLDKGLPQLPPSVKALGGSAMGVGCYWTERGGEEALSQITEFLLSYPGVEPAKPDAHPALDRR